MSSTDTSSIFDEINKAPKTLNFYEEEQERLSHRLDIERQVLGGYLISPTFPTNKNALKLEIEHFMFMEHQYIFYYIKILIERDEAISKITIRDMAAKDAPYHLGIIVDSLIASANAGDIVGMRSINAAKLLYGLYIDEKADELGEKIKDLYKANVNMSPKEKLDYLNSQVHKFCELSDTGEDDKLFSMEELSNQVKQRLEDTRYDLPSLKGFTTGFGDLDELTFGLVNSSFYVIGAPTGMGKTTLALNMVYHAAKNIKVTHTEGKKNIFLYLSLEMHAVSLAEKLISMESGVTLKKIVTNQMSEAERDLVNEAVEATSKLPIQFCYPRGLTLEGVVTYIKKINKKSHVCCVFIDYLQLMSCSNKAINSNLYAKTTEISRGLKGVASSNDIPVITLAQLSRGVDNRQNKRPRSSDLKDSGAIEQDADGIFLIYQPSYYDGKTDDNGKTEQKAPVDKNEVQLILDKNRVGEKGITKVTFHAEIGKYEERLY